MDYWFRRLVEDLFQPHTQGLVSTPTAVASGVGIFPADLTPTYDVGSFRFLVNFAGDLAGLNLVAGTSTTSAVGPVLSTVGTLAGPGWYAFDVPVQSPFSYNLFPTDAATVLFALCHESGAMS